MPRATLPLTVTYTVFANLWPKTPKDLQVRKKVPWPELEAFIEQQENVHYTNKKDCPLISLCSYGTVKTEKGVLRHAGNVKAVYGVEVDYDAEVITPQEAMAKLKRAGIRSIIYTSPSHQPDHPRWRALVPLSKPHHPDNRAEMVARVNRVLGGVLARESFTLSQSFYIGHVRTAEYLVLKTPGSCVDEVDIEPLYPSGTDSGQDPQFDATPDDVFIEAFEKGTGRYDAALALSSRWVARGTDPEKVRAKLKKLVYHAERDGVDPTTDHGENLYESIDRLVDSAVKKYGIEKADADEDEKSDAPDDQPLDLDTVFDMKEPPEPRFTIDGWLNYPQVGLYSAHGGSYKSMISLEVGYRIVLGKTVFGQSVRQGPVVFLSAEDDRDELRTRLFRMNKKYAPTDAEKRLLKDGLKIFDWTSRDVRLFEETARGEGNTTALRRKVRKFLRRYQPVLLVLDSSPNFYDANEIDRRQVRKFLDFLRIQFAMYDRGCAGGCSVLLLSHVDATTLKEGKEGKGFSGSTAWHNSVRNLWYSYRDAGIRYLELKKINYAKAGARVPIEWDDDAKLPVIGKVIEDRDLVSRYSFRALRALQTLQADKPPVFRRVKARIPDKDKKNPKPEQLACEVHVRDLMVQGMGAESSKNLDGDTGIEAVRKMLLRLQEYGYVDVNDEHKTTNKKSSRPVKVYRLTEKGHKEAANKPDNDSDDEDKDDP